MDRNAIRELHSKTVKELQTMVVGIRKELASIQVEKRLGKKKNTREFTSKRNDLARVLTVLGEKEIIENQKEKKA